MADATSRPGRLLEPGRAVNDYLAALLQECPAIPLAEPDADRAPSPRHGITPDAASGEHDPDSTVAAWAYPEFQAQLFRVGGLRLAIPVAKLHGVVPRCDQIRAQPDRPDWCHGLLSYQGRTVRVIDTAALVLPAERRALIADSQGGYVLIVGDGGWGLTCHGVEEVVPLAWDEIKWRSRQGKRPWLAGTALGRMCAVLDTEAFAALFGIEPGATTAPGLARG